jgi:hypothetical protein
MVAGVNSDVLYMIYCKNFYRYHDVPPPSKTIKKEKKLRTKHHFDISVL